MTDYKLIDSSVWIGYIVNGNHIDVMESGEKMLLASVSLIEISKKLARLGVSAEEIKKKIEHIKMQSTLIPLDESVADKASELVIVKKMPMADSVVYASAILNDATLLTLDNDFRGLEGVQIL